MTESVAFLTDVVVEGTNEDGKRWRFTTPSALLTARADVFQQPTIDVQSRAKVTYEMVDA
jgi:hypothetical protein